VTSTVRSDGGPILQIDGLITEIATHTGIVRAVAGVSLDVRPGEVLGIVGESGCGKSMTALSVMGLLPRPGGRIASGTIRLAGVGNLTRLSTREMKAIRGRDISMIFQDPTTSLNPVTRIGRQIGEAIRAHETVSHEAARRRAIEMLDLVGIAAPEKRVDAYPHQLSGGMRQRVMIAMALACKPRLMLADEPTTALDVTIQAQILALMKQLQRETGTAIVLITHDLGVIARMADRVVVMYAGVVVEMATVADIFERPLHPYTAGLLAAIPRADADVARRRLNAIPGVVPSLRRLPTGCRFSDRCPQVHVACATEPPLSARGGRAARCWLVAPPSTAVGAAHV
jgi:oligopeptide/dipeptide ABC transporter ATP-binding protein